MTLLKTSRILTIKEQYSFLSQIKKKTIIIQNSILHIKHTKKNAGDHPTIGRSGQFSFLALLNWNKTKDCRWQCVQSFYSHQEKISHKFERLEIRLIKHLSVKLNFPLHTHWKLKIGMQENHRNHNLKVAFRSVSINFYGPFYRSISPSENKNDIWRTEFSLITH